MSRATVREGGSRGGAAVGVDRRKAPGTGVPAPLRVPPVRRFTLSNGLRVVLVERRDVPVVAVEALFPGGAAAVDGSRAGLASLATAMLVEGAGERSAMAIAAALERLGASLHPGAGHDAGAVELSALSPRLDGALDVLADVLLRPTFDAAELERVRRERMDLSLQLSDEPGAVANDALAAALYGEAHPWGAPLLGTRASLATLTREDVLGYHRERHHAGNAVVLVAGDVGEGPLRALLEPRLGGWTKRASAEPSPPRAPTLDRSVLYLADRPGAAQSEIRLGRVTAARSAPDYFALVVLNTVLGGAFTSRLNTTLREERGYTYGAHSTFHMRRHPGPFVARAAVHTPVTGDAVAVFLEEIERLRESPVPSVELERARSFAALRLPRRFETAGDLVARVAEQVLYGLPDDYWSTYVERLLAVSAEDVLAAARRHLDPRHMAVVVAGDAAAVETPLRALGLPVTAWRGPLP